MFDPPPEQTTREPTPGFTGVWTPADIYFLAQDGHISHSEAFLLSMITALHDRNRGGCFASNAYLADKMGKSHRTLKRMIQRLKEMGLVEDVSFDGRKRVMRTTWAQVEVREVASEAVSGTAEGPEMAPLRRCKWPPYNKADTNTLTGPTGTVGFGMGKVVDKADATDKEAAERLAEIVRGHLPRRDVRLRRIRPSTWAQHFAKLRTLDEVSPDRIKAALAWYATRVGEDYVPEAFGGETFRKKFPAIEAAMERDPIAAVVGTTATKVATRLKGLGWPKGSEAGLPGAVQASLDAYRAWCATHAGFVDRLRRDDLAEEYKDRKRLARFGEHLAQKLPQPAQFVEGWFRTQHARVRTWEGWSGNVATLVWRATGDAWQATGQGWAEAYAGKPGLWDRFVKVMEDETA